MDGVALFFKGFFTEEKLKMQKRQRSFFDADIETMGPEDRKNYYLENLSEVLNHAYINAPAMKEKFDHAGIKPFEIREFEDLNKFPFLNKQEIKELQQKKPPFGGLLSVPTEDLQRIYLSPGPIFDPEEKGHSGMMEAKGLYSCGFRPGDIVILTLSYHLVPAGLGLDKGLREIGATVVPSGTGNTELQVQLMKDLKVTGFVGTASFFMILIKKAEELGYDLLKDLNIKNALFTAEKVPDEILKIVGDNYHIQTSQAYGVADIGLFAYECDQKSGMHIAEEVFVEIINSDTGEHVEAGETGEVVVTSFNKAYPLIRLKTGDLSYLDPKPCSCGRTSPRLVKITGRIGDSFKVRGMFIYDSQVKDAFSSVKEIYNYAVEVTKPKNRDEINLKVEIKDEKVNKDRMSKILSNKFENSCRLKIDSIDYLPAGTMDLGVKKLLDKRKW